GVVESCHLDSFIVCRSQEGVARPKTGSDNAQALVPLLLEPIEAAADVDHPLSACVKGAANVGGDGIVGAPNLSRTPNIVIRHAEPQHRNAQTIQDPAE